MEKNNTFVGIYLVFNDIDKNGNTDLRNQSQSIKVFE